MLLLVSPYQRGIYAAALAVGVAACGGWTDADTKSVNDALRAQSLLTSDCKSDAGCSPGEVDAVEHATSCNLSSMLVRHGAADLDAGECAP